MQKIIRRREVTTEIDLGDEFPPLLQRLYTARGVTAPEDLKYQLSCLHRPDFKGLDTAVALLAEAVLSQANILIVGDFDADGATSCALSVLALRAMGHPSVDFLVPNRFEYGYGLTPEIVQVAAGLAPDVIVTVDNGISSVEGVRAARELGISVVVTDHHLPGEQLPDADAIVNPNQPDCPFPSKNLAGVGVIFYVMNALRGELRRLNWFADQQIAEPNMADFLDLVALGTVADVVPLDRNNRILVEQGMRRIRAGIARPGILEILQVAGRQPTRLVATDLGFAIGPRLNAAGRLDDMSLGIQCLLCDSPELAREMALALDEFNRDRKTIESGMRQKAMVMLQQVLDSDPQSLPWGVCLYDARWHQGVIGILASRIKDYYHRPSIVFADGEQGEIKGSARSVPGLHIRDALDAVAASHPGLLNKFGGHAMAAGLTLARDDFDAFAKAFDAEVRRQLREEDLDAVIVTDGPLQDDEFDLNLAARLREAGPWGQHFPEPLFDGEFFLVQQRIVGEKHLKMTLARDREKQNLVDAIAFNIDTGQWPNPNVERVRLAYRLDVNEYRGRRSLQLMVHYLEALAA